MHVTPQAHLVRLSMVHRACNQHHIHRASHFNHMIWHSFTLKRSPVCQDTSHNFHYHEA